MLNVRF